MGAAPEPAAPLMGMVMVMLGRPMPTEPLPEAGLVMPRLLIGGVLVTGCITGAAAVPAAGSIAVEGEVAAPEPAALVIPVSAGDAFPPHAALRHIITSHRFVCIVLSLQTVRYLPSGAPGPCHRVSNHKFQNGAGPAQASVLP